MNELPYLNSSDDKAIEEKVYPWLEKRGIPLNNFRKLKPYYKLLLYNLVSGSTELTTDLDYGNLYQKLCSPGIIAGRGSINPDNFITHDELEKFFSPLTPGEKLPDLYKY